MDIFRFLFVSCLLATLIVCLAFITKLNHTPYVYPDLQLFPSMEETKNPPTIEGVELGRLLFYDPILSLDSTISCSSCHLQKYAFSDSMRFSTGINTKKSLRNTPAIFNLAWNRHFFWDGKANSIEEQAFHPVRSDHEMGLDWATAIERLERSDLYKRKFKAYFQDDIIDSFRVAKMLGQFERVLISSDSKFDRVLKGIDFFTTQEYEGYGLMNNQAKGNCIHCHDTDGDVLATNRGFSNNGLESYQNADEYLDKGKGGITNKSKDVGLFKVPSLRNIAVTGPYMHDGRFQTLEEVLDFYSEGVQNSLNIDPRMGHHFRKGVVLTDTEKTAIISFLHTLTDSTFLKDPAFSNPF